MAEYLHVLQARAEAADDAVELIQRHIPRLLSQYRDRISRLRRECFIPTGLAGYAVLLRYCIRAVSKISSDEHVPAYAGPEHSSRREIDYEGLPLQLQQQLLRDFIVCDEPDESFDGDEMRSQYLELIERYSDLLTAAGVEMARAMLEEVLAAEDLPRTTLFACFQSLLECSIPLIALLDAEREHHRSETQGLLSELEECCTDLVTEVEEALLHPEQDEALLERAKELLLFLEFWSGLVLPMHGYCSEFVSFVDEAQ